MLFKPLLTVYLQLPISTVYELQLKGINQKEDEHGTPHEQRYEELFLLTDWCSVFFNISLLH